MLHQKQHLVVTLRKAVRFSLDTRYLLASYQMHLVYYIVVHAPSGLHAMAGCRDKPVAANDLAKLSSGADPGSKVGNRRVSGHLDP